MQNNSDFARSSLTNRLSHSRFKIEPLNALYLDMNAWMSFNVRGVSPARVLLATGHVSSERLAPCFRSLTLANFSFDA